MKRIGAAGAVLAAGALVVLGSLWIEVESRFRGDLFDLPARIYGRPMIVERGMDVGSAGLVDRLERLGYREARGVDVAEGEFETGQRRLIWVPRSGPDTAAVEESIVLRLHRDQRVRDVLRGDRRPLGSVELPPERIGELYGARHERRSLVTLDDVPPHLVTAILTIEDQRFYDHFGLDLRRIAGAMVANVRAGRIVQGGSTVTQQLVKNLYLSPERTVVRKLREALMAVLLELGHTKREILEAYLNEVYLGQHGAVSIHGFGEASRYYFGKDVAELDTGESALLAGMIRAPGLYAPFRNPEAARERRDQVLDILEVEEQLSAERRAAAARKPLELRAPSADERAAPHFAALLRADLAEELGEELLLSDGLEIVSTLDPQLQRVANRAVFRGLERLERDHPELLRPEQPLEAALVALDPHTGDVLALVGGRSYSRSQWNRATQARRQPGSVFKPIVALAALSRDDEGQPPMTLAARVDDEPLSVETNEGLWTPANFDEEFRGQVTLRDAIERSLNVPMARVGLAIGPERIVETARRAGIESRLRPVPSLALGSFELSLVEITRAYAVLASGGNLPELRTHSVVRDPDGAVLIEAEPASTPAFDPAEVFLVTSALQGVVDRGTARRLRWLGIDGPIAGKTGTTNDFRDAWFVGYTPDLVAGVWVGFDDGHSLGIPASEAALPIFANFVLRGVGRDLERRFGRPDGVELVAIDAESGKRASFGCPGKREVFLDGTAPRERCAGSIIEAVTNPFRKLFGRHPKKDRRPQKPTGRPRGGGAASDEPGPSPGWQGGVWTPPEDH